MKHALFASLALLVGCAPTPSTPVDAAPDAMPAEASLDDSAVSDAQSAPDASSAPDAGVSMDVAVPSDAGPLAPVERVVMLNRRTHDCVSAPTDFGTYGPVTQYDRYEVRNPAAVAEPLPVQVLVPLGGATSNPVLFYSHPFGGSDWRRVRTLLETFVSNSYVVVFTPYATTGATVCERYDTLWGGHSAAVDALGALARMDTTRVGFIGHSFGAGATPWLASQAVTARGWGTNGMFMHSNAPWYGFRMDPARWAAFSRATRLEVMVFRDDDTNDHLIAIEDQWRPFPQQKQYVMLVSDTNGACSHTADHIVPSTDSERMDGVRYNALDTWGVGRHALALAACTLRANQEACAVIDGNYPARQTDMGMWLSTGAPVARAVRSDAPAGVTPPSPYTFPVARRALFPCEGRGGA
jgi:hypothetical protein